jgi:hypothetical protein
MHFRYFTISLLILPVSLARASESSIALPRLGGDFELVFKLRKHFRPVDAYIEQVVAQKKSQYDELIRQGRATRQQTEMVLANVRAATQGPAIDPVDELTLKFVKGRLYVCEAYGKKKQIELYRDDLTFHCLIQGAERAVRVAKGNEVWPKSSAPILPIESGLLGFFRNAKRVQGGDSMVSGDVASARVAVDPGHIGYLAATCKMQQIRGQQCVQSSSLRGASGSLIENWAYSDYQSVLGTLLPRHISVDFYGVLGSGAQTKPVRVKSVIYQLTSARHLDATDRALPEVVVEGAEIEDLRSDAPTRFQYHTNAGSLDEQSRLAKVAANSAPKASSAGVDARVFPLVIMFGLGCGLFATSLKSALRRRRSA